MWAVVCSLYTDDQRRNREVASESESADVGLFCLLVRGAQRTRVEGMRRWRRSQRQAQSLFKNKLKQNEQQWLASRNKVQRFEFSYSQKRALRRWFDSMDADGSGDISVNELADALLSTGTTAPDQRPCVWKLLAFCEIRSCIKRT